MPDNFSLTVCSHINKYLLGFTMCKVLSQTFLGSVQGAWYA